MTVAEAVAVRVFRIDDGRIGSYLGILVLGTALLALLTGIAARLGWGKTIAAAAFVIAIGAGAELVGLYSGRLFGRYEYTDWWLPYLILPGGKLFPILLPIAWFLVVALCYLVLARSLRGGALILGTAVLAAAVDLALEPVITRVVWLWRWLEPTPLLGAPYSNLGGWLLTAGLGAAALNAFQVWKARELPHPRWMFPLGLCFTALVGLAYGEERGAVALALLPVAFWIRRGSGALPPPQASRS